jgi:hypothetical protein
MNEIAIAQVKKLYNERKDSKTFPELMKKESLLQRANTVSQGRYTGKNGFPMQGILMRWREVFHFRDAQHSV